MHTNKKILIALGGNALSRSGEKGTIEEQLLHVKETCEYCVDLINEGYDLVITHGNGPQVGNILLKNEFSADKIPPMPLDVCGAQTQGMIGYLIQQQLYNQLKKHKINKPVVTICSQVLVDQHDIAFKKPTKPIGPFYTEKRAEELRKEKGWYIIEQAGKGFRRVVPSPTPIEIIESSVIKKFVDEQVIVIACGGGGIPVINNQHGYLEGVEAVIDKDRTAAILAEKIGADILLILTDVEHVAINFNTPKQLNLSKITVEEGQNYLKNGEFGIGSMGPKVEAACHFIMSGGKKAIITSLEMCKDALHGKSGTLIIK